MTQLLINDTKGTILDGAGRCTTENVLHYMYLLRIFTKDEE